MDTLNVAEEAFAGTVTETGVVSAEELSVSETWVPPAGAGLDRVTVHEVLAFCASVAAAQFTELTWIVAVRLRKVLTEPPRVAVTAAL